MQVLINRAGNSTIFQLSAPPIRRANVSKSRCPSLVSGNALYCLPDGYVFLTPSHSPPGKYFSIIRLDSHVSLFSSSHLQCLMRPLYAIRLTRDSFPNLRYYSSNPFDIRSAAPDLIGCTWSTTRELSLRIRVSIPMFPFPNKSTRDILFKKRASDVCGN